MLRCVNLGYKNQIFRNLEMSCRKAEIRFWLSLLDVVGNESRIGKPEQVFKVRKMPRNIAWNAKKIWKIASIKGQWQISLPNWFENTKNGKLAYCQCQAIFCYCETPSKNAKFAELFNSEKYQMATVFPVINSNLLSNLQSNVASTVLLIRTGRYFYHITGRRLCA